MTYKTSLDRTATTITIAVAVLFTFIIVGQYSFIRDDGRSIVGYTAIACLLIYFLAFAFRPIEYVVTVDELIVRRLLFSVHIKRADIKTVELIDREEIRGSFRIAGVGGLFGYYGAFTNSSLGFMTWYMTRRDRPVLVKTVDNKKILFSPDDPIQFVSELRA
jgi:hypothetical protein